MFRTTIPLLTITLLSVTACGSDSGSDTGASTATSTVVPNVALSVPEALQFRAPLVGGGEFDMAALADRPVVLWFWAPY